MPIPTCAVTCRASANGAPAAGVRVSAQLSRYEVHDGYVVPSVVEGVTDAAGAVVLDLWPNELGSTGSHYLVTLQPAKGEPLRLRAVVPNVAAADLHAIALLPTYPGKSDQQVALEVVQAAVAQASNGAAAAQVAATSAAGSAGAAAGNAAAAAASAASAGGAQAAATAAATSAQGSAAAAAAAASAAQAASVAAAGVAAQVGADAATAAAGGAAATTAQTGAVQARDAAIAARDVAQAARDAATIGGRVYASTAAGLAATSSGQYFSVPSASSTEHLLLYLNNGGAAQLVKTYPSSAFVLGGRLALNSGADYPLRSATRSGTTSVANASFNALLLECRVFNAVAGKLYRIAYQQNAASLDGENAFDWIIEEYDEATYATAASATLLVSYQKATYGAQQQIDPAGGIQTVRLYPVNRPKMRIDITVDASKLPTAGVPINANSPSTQAGWSWIIDPSCYVIEDATVLRSTDPIVISNSSLPNSLLLNQGKAYPLKSATRDGITSAENATWSNLLLNCVIYGANAGKLYRIAYNQNRATLAGDNNLDWIIEEHDAATYATASVATQIVAYTDTQQQLDPAGGVQLIVLRPAAYPSMQIHLVVDAAKLPAAGTTIDSYSSNTKPGWSWIVDPVCYVVWPAGSKPDSLTVNKGQSMPCRALSRNGVTSQSNTFLLNALLDARVVGARSGKVYGIRYFKNGTTALTGPADGWIIEEQDAATYGGSSTATTVLTYTDTAPAITRSGIQTVRLSSPSATGLEFYLTLDTDALPAYGTFVKMNASTDPGYSWIIDPSCYTYAGSTSAGGADYAMSVASDAAGNLTAIWQSGPNLYRLRFGPNGFNSLPNIKGIDVGLATTDRKAVSWTQINTAGTDWLPPMVVQAAANGDGGSMIYTGGNHGSDGSAGGSQTARNAFYKLYADGQPMDAAAWSGDYQCVRAVIINELLAYNTITLGRYVVRQAFIVDIRPGSVEVHTEVRALEAVSVKTDNGPQMVTVGFQDSMLYVGGQYATRVAFDATTNSGIKSGYPNAWAVVLKGTNGQQVSWMDRSYQAGDGRFVHANAPYIRFGGAANTKCYHAAVASVDAVLAAGDAYRWRGGYAWQAPGLEGAAFDSVVHHHRGSVPCQALIKTAADWTVLP